MLPDVLLTGFTVVTKIPFGSTLVSSTSWRMSRLTAPTCGATVLLGKASAPSGTFHHRKSGADALQTNTTYPIASQSYV
jgi:hypothetical protein